jgi:hypothetical protein
MDKAALIKLLDDPAVMKALTSKLNKDNRKVSKRVTVHDVTYYHTCKLCGATWESQKSATFLGKVVDDFKMEHESCKSCKANLMILPKEMLVDRMIERAKTYLCHGRQR